MSLSEGLSASSVTVQYSGRTVVDSVTLPRLECGTITAVVGPNGAGKSTLLSALGFIRPSQGNIALGSVDLRKLNPRERAKVIGFMPQALPHGTELTAFESILVALRGVGLDARHSELQAIAILTDLNIAHLALKRLDSLSGGERQLVSLAQSLAGDPQLLLLDEPTSALDLARQLQIMEHLERVARRGAIVMVVLHDLSLAARWVDQVVVMQRGRVHVVGNPAQVFTPKVLAEVYGIDARVEIIDGRLVVLPEGARKLVTDSGA